MLPLLMLAGDQQELHIGEAIERLASQFRLTAEERARLLPSGRNSTFRNRVWWARTHLTKARLMENTGRGISRITARGLQALSDAPKVINIAYLRQYPEFREFQKAAQQPESTAISPEAPTETQTPEEILQASYQSLRKSLAEELLEQAKTCSPSFFKRLVVDLLVAMEYGGSLKDAGKARSNRTGGERRNAQTYGV